MSKIFGAGNSSPQTSTTAAIPPISGTTQPAVKPPLETVPQSPAAAAPVDVAAVLDGMAVKNSEKLDWKKSIVDLMKLLDMDSSLSARKELATELNYSGDKGDSASMNIWLHKQVLKKLSENGGKVPADLLD